MSFKSALMGSPSAGAMVSGMLLTPAERKAKIEAFDKLLKEYPGIAESEARNSYGGLMRFLYK